MDENWIIRLLGLFFIALGIVIHMGYLKKLYFASRGGIYGYTTMGLLFVVYTYYVDFSKTHTGLLVYYDIIFGLLLAATLYLSIAKPSFIKPTWVKWIEKFPPKVIQAMTEDVKADPKWEKNVVSEDAVNKWARRLTHNK